MRAVFRPTRTQAIRCVYVSYVLCISMLMYIMHKGNLNPSLSIKKYRLKFKVALLCTILWFVAGGGWRVRDTISAARLAFGTIFEYMKMCI